MRTISLNGLDVSRIGLGAMGISAFYTGAGSDDAASIRTIHKALDLGVTHIDTAEAYGPYTNEELVGRAVKGRRDQVVLATKFGGGVSHTGRPGLDSSPANIRLAVEGSLRRLGTDHIDLYYQHRVDPDTPIEETVGALAKLVAEGKVGHVGLSEAGPETIRRAHAIHPVAAVQTEYSLWTRDPRPRSCSCCASSESARSRGLPRRSGGGDPGSGSRRRWSAHRRGRPRTGRDPAAWSVRARRSAHDWDG